MSQDELAVMSGSKCILQLRGVRPFLSQKFNTKKHKQYINLFDANPKNKFNIEKYVQTLKDKKLLLSKNQEFDIFLPKMDDKQN